MPQPRYGRRLAEVVDWINSRLQRGPAPGGSFSGALPIEMGPAASAVRGVLFDFERSRSVACGAAAKPLLADCRCRSVQVVRMMVAIGVLQDTESPKPDGTIGLPWFVLAVLASANALISAPVTCASSARVVSARSWGFQKRQISIMMTRWPRPSIIALTHATSHSWC